MAQALRSQRCPTVIDAIVDPAEFPPLSMRIETLEKFFNDELAAEAPPPEEPKIVIRRPLETPARVPAHSRHGSNGTGGNGSTGGNGAQELQRRQRQCQQPRLPGPQGAWP